MPFWGSGSIAFTQLVQYPGMTDWNEEYATLHYLCTAKSVLQNTLIAYGNQLFIISINVSQSVNLIKVNKIEWHNNYGII
jgi:hypothetical protein